MFLPGDRTLIYYDLWFQKTNKDKLINTRIGSYRKVNIVVLRTYHDSPDDYAYVCKRCDLKTDDVSCNPEFMIRDSEIRK